MPQFLVRALIAGIIASVLCAFVGVFVILRKMAFFANAVAHSSLAGVAIGFFTGTNPLLTATGFSVVIGISIGYLYRKSLLFIDTIIGIFLPSTMAVGIILLSLVKGYKPDLLSYLFGNILTVSQKDLYLIGILSVITFIFLVVFFNEITLISFDEDWARVKGIPVVVIDYIFFIILALIVVISTKVVGIILVSALVVIPPASALNISKSFHETVIYSVLFGILSAVGGIFASYVLDLPTGPIIVLTAGVIFLITLLVASFIK